MAKLFGTDGIRGEAGRFPLDTNGIYAAGRSLACHLATKIDEGRAPRIVIGRDTRESGAWIEAAFIAGAREAGAVCETAGIITTPGVAYLTRTLPTDAGVVISASHNPFQDNGIKIFAPSGRKLDDEMERRIEADIQAFAAEDKEPEAKKASMEIEANDTAHSAALRLRYLDYLEKDVAVGLDLQGLSIVLDCANGAAYELAPALFARLGARIIAINDAPDGRNINLDCGSLHTEGLREKVVESRADIGVAFDGDADRALFVDAHGKFVDGDATLWAMAQHFKAHGQLEGDAVVATVMSNIGLEIALHTLGVKLLRADVGDKYVLEELLRTKTVLGGEQSGHIIFPRRSLAGDGMMTTLFLLRAMRETNKQLGELVQGFKRYPQVLVNVRVREKRAFDQVEEISRAARGIEEQLGARGRLLLRYSGTESLARVMIEGERQEDIERQAHALAATIKDSLGA
ncbi:MAG: phosphoglucosamine mutase [Pyrinomonadaceae bacterium]